MRVSREVWKERMGNLMIRRKLSSEGVSKVKNRIHDYYSHFEKCRLGSSVLDVGCGDMNLKFYCPKKYTGIDAFPISKEVIKAEIENFTTEERFETVIAFAVLDGLYDLEKAIANMKRLCTRNIIFLTGMNIPPDKLHTIEIKEEDLNRSMAPDFKQSYREELVPKVFLLEYSR